MKICESALMCPPSALRSGNTLFVQGGYVPPILAGGGDGPPLRRDERHRVCHSGLGIVVVRDHLFSCLSSLYEIVFGGLTVIVRDRFWRS